MRLDDRIETKTAPFSRSMKEDDRLEIFVEDFESILLESATKRDTQLDQLKSIAPYPEPYIFALFSNKAYLNWHKPQEYKNDELKLPDGWQFLTAAHGLPYKKNFGVDWTWNGYFAVAFWHPDRNQIVVAHRGTDLTNAGALWADGDGIMKGNYYRMPQLRSAITFVDKIKTAIIGVKDSRKVRIQLFLTGHSLGGWLAQATTFSFKYLELVNGLFNLGDPFCVVDAHTVVFDSPGCEDVISKMCEDFDVNSDHATVSAESLDVTSYLSAPNPVNTFGLHIGTKYRIYGASRYVSNFPVFNWRGINYILATHNMEFILNAFDPKTGQVHEYENRELKIREIVDWPNITCHKGLEIYLEFFQWANELNEYEPDERDEKFLNWKKQNPSYHPIRYQTRRFSENKISAHSFTEKESLFLRSYYALRKEYPEDIEIDDSLFKFFDSDSRSMIVKKLTAIYLDEQDRKYFYCEGAIKDIVPFVKGVLEMDPEIFETIRNNNISQTLYRFESKFALKQVNMLRLDFAGKVCSILQFLGDDTKQIMWYEVDNETEYGIVKLLKTLYDRKQKFSYFSLDDLTEKSLWKPQIVLGGDNTILVLNCSSKSLEFFEKSCLIQWIKNNSTMKVIFASHECDLLYRCCLVTMMVETEFVSSCLFAKEETIQWDDLSLQCQQSLANENSLIVHGGEMSIKTFIGDETVINTLMQSNPQLLKRIMDKKPITLSGYEKSVTDADWAIIPIHLIVTVETLISICKPDVKLYMTGILPGSSQSDRILEKFESRRIEITFTEGNKNSSSFKLFCLKNENIKNKNYWIHFSNDQFRLKVVYDPKLYMERNLIFPKEIILKEDALKREHFYKVEHDMWLLGECLNTASKFTRKTQLKDHWGRLVITPYCTGKLKCIITKKKDNIFGTKYILTDALVPLRELRDCIEKVNKYLIPLNDQFVSSIKDTTAIIIDEPGMGKSMTSNQLALANCCSRWVLKINLNKCHDLLSQFKGASFWPADLDNLLRFLAEAAAFGPNVDRIASQQFIKCKLENKSAHWPILLICDGFDEIRNHENKEKLLYILQALQMHKFTICLTSRKSDKEIIQNRIYSMETEFKPLTAEQQRKYLKEFWKNWVGLNFSQLDFEKSFPTYSNGLLQKADSLNLKNFIGVPLQVRLMAEGFINNFSRCVVDKNDEYFNDLRLSTMYGSFIQSKFDIYLNEKLDLGMQMENITHLRTAVVTPFLKMHRYMAFKYMTEGCFNITEYLQHMAVKKDIQDIDITLVGLILLLEGEYIEFLHKTIGEYLAAEYIHKQLKKKRHHLEYIFLKKKCITDIWTLPSNRMIRTFLNDLFEASQLGESIFQDLDCDRTDWSDSPINLLALHVCIEEGLTASVQSILRYICEDNQRADIFLTKRNPEGFTSLYYAAKYDEGCVTWFLDRICNFPSDLIRKILLATTFVSDDPKADPINQCVINKCDEKEELKHIAREVSTKWDLIEQFMIAVYDGNSQDVRNVLERAQHPDIKDYLILSKISTIRSDISKPVWCYKSTTALELAIIKNYKEIKNIILGSASVACRNQLEPVLKGLEEVLAKVDQCVRMYKEDADDENVKNSIYQATINDDFRFLDAVISRDVPVNIKNIFGKGAYEMAEERNLVQTQVILRQYLREFNPDELAEPFNKRMRF